MIPEPPEVETFALLAKATIARQRRAVKQFDDGRDLSWSDFQAEVAKAVGPRFGRAPLAAQELIAQRIHRRLRGPREFTQAEFTAWVTKEAGAVVPEVLREFAP